MSNLLDFQEKLREEGKAIYSIERGILNPQEVEYEEIMTSVVKTSLKEYDNKVLRDFIQDHSQTLTENGNTIKGEVKNDRVVLTAVKEI